MADWVNNMSMPRVVYEMKPKAEREALKAHRARRLQARLARRAANMAPPPANMAPPPANAAPPPADLPDDGTLMGAIRGAFAPDRVGTSPVQAMIDRPPLENLVITLTKARERDRARHAALAESQAALAECRAALAENETALADCQCCAALAESQAALAECRDEIAGSRTALAGNVHMAHDIADMADQVTQEAHALQAELEANQKELASCRDAQATLQAAVRDLAGEMLAVGSATQIYYSSRLFALLK